MLYDRRRRLDRLNTLINKMTARSLTSLTFAIGWAVCGRQQPGHESLDLTVRRYGTFCVSALVGLWPDFWPFDLKTGAQCNTCHGVSSCQFLWYYYAFSIYGPLGQHGSDWSRDLVTLIFDLEGHGACGWCESSSSTRVSSLKFVGLAVRKIWRTMCVSINGPGDLDLWLFDTETNVRVASKVGNLPFKFVHARPLVSRIIRYVRDGRTDGRTKATLIAPFHAGGGINRRWYR